METALMIIAVVFFFGGRIYADTKSDIKRLRNSFKNKRK